MNSVFVGTTTAAQCTPAPRDHQHATEQLLKDASEQHTKPLWAQMTRLNPPLPNPRCIPHLWEYDKIRPSLLRAGEIITEEQAERRVLMLVNPSRGTPICPAFASAPDLIARQTRPTQPILFMPVSS